MSVIVSPTREIVDFKLNISPSCAINISEVVVDIWGEFDITDCIEKNESNIVLGHELDFASPFAPSIVQSFFYYRWSGRLAQEADLFAG